MDKFEKKRIAKIRSIKNTWYDWLINNIPESKRKNVGGFKDSKILLVFLRHIHLNKLFMKKKAETKKTKNTKTI